MAFYDPSPEHLAKLSGPCCSSYSGGKDSTSLVTWIEWLRRTGQITATKPQLVQSNTRVEDPALSALSREMMNLLSRSGWECAVVEPPVNQRLYNRILGIGNTPVHAGGRNMRWCTRATKIGPMKRWRAEHSGGYTLTGVRINESAIRNEKLFKRGCSAGGECGVPDVNDGENIYGPIIKWTTCNVWAWLCGDPSELDASVRDVMGDVFAISAKLYDIYEVKRGQDGFDWEGPTYTSARFGCIGCPAISSTREAPRSVIARHGIASPLNELYDVWFEARRRDNRCVRNIDGKDGRGPIRMAVRKKLFDRVMDIQRRAGIVLITQEDEAFIRECWAAKVYPRGWSEADEATQCEKDELFPAPDSTLDSKTVQTNASDPTPTASNAIENAGGGDNNAGTKVGRIIKIESSPRSDDSHTPNVHQDLSANRGEKDEGPERTLDSKSPHPTPQPAAREAL